MSSSAVTCFFRSRSIQICFLFDPTMVIRGQCNSRSERDQSLLGSPSRIERRKLGQDYMHRFIPGDVVTVYGSNTLLVRDYLCAIQYTCSTAYRNHCRLNENGRPCSLQEYDLYYEVRLGEQRTAYTLRSADHTSSQQLPVHILVI